MSRLTAYDGYLTADELGLCYDECDAALALLRGDYTKMVELLKETPEDLEEVLGYIYTDPEGILALVAAFPETRDRIKKELKLCVEADPCASDLKFVYAQLSSQ